MRVRPSNAPGRARARLLTGLWLGCLAALLALPAVWALARPLPARADGDPASDVLLGADVFYPYAPTAKVAETRLNAATAALRAAKDPIKVALIEAPTDLGVIPSLFGNPQGYAKFLDTEISFTGPQRLLVVMPAGYGTSQLSAADQAVVAAAAKPAPGSGATGLATAALVVVAKIAAADGHPLPAALTAGAGTTGGAGATGVSGAGGASGSGAGGGTTRGNPRHGDSATVLIIALVVIALLGAGGLIAATLRRRGHPA